MNPAAIPYVHTKGLVELLGFHSACRAMVRLARDRVVGWVRTMQPGLPQVINFQVNDICNSRCIMCRVWQGQRERALAVADFEAVLGDPFFSSVRHIGITGGEPTLCEDLPAFYASALRVLPRLEGASFITNGLLTDRVVRLYQQIHAMYREHAKSLTGMVSLDGVGPVHDKVRGVPGAFEKASRTLRDLRSAGVPTVACCTIVKSNVYGLHDVLDWGRANGIGVRFRIGEFINRLYNHCDDQQIRNFDEFERRHLVAFFYLLLSDTGLEEEIGRTYVSILSLLTGGVRLTQCPYQTARALNIDSRGCFAFCAPKGHVHQLGPFPRSTVRRHIFERFWIQATHCPSCIHDYHADWTSLPAWILRETPDLDKTMYGIDEDRFPTQEIAPMEFDLRSLQRLLLVGWYGTETAGDVAILAGLLQEYLTVNARLRFVLFSLNPYYSRLMLSEMDPVLASHVTVSAYHGPAAWHATQTCQAVIMAGGPLMDIEETGLVARLFLRFHRVGKPCLIEGCGVGPLVIDRFRANVNAMARLASRISVRDHASLEALRSFGIGKSIQVREDPSLTYVQSTGIRRAPQSVPVIRCFLRELTHEYPQALSPAQAEALLIRLVRQLLEWYPGHRVELWPMHYFPLGNDDRRLAFRLRAAVPDNRLAVEHRPQTPDGILRAMADAAFCVCMRYHSVVFASALHIPFAAIDYTAGGKVRAFLADTGQLHRCLRLQDLDRLEHTSLLAALAESLREGLS